MSYAFGIFKLDQLSSRKYNPLSLFLLINVKRSPVFWARMQSLPSLDCFHPLPFSILITPMSISTSWHILASFPLPLHRLWHFLPVNSPWPLRHAVCSDFDAFKYVLSSAWKWPLLLCSPDENVFILPGLCTCTPLPEVFPDLHLQKNETHLQFWFLKYYVSSHNSH